METQLEIASGVWTAPECPFRIEYVPRVLDEIRLAVTDAFFSLPRGGAEIGGILLGSYGLGRVTIAGYQALDCEHAFGPSFTLSPRDKEALSAILLEARPENLQPVGWYHSHTRSDIFLSDADLEIYDTHFPRRLQVALVIRPHTFQPARAGFFFRPAAGEIHRSESYNEFQMEPLTVRTAPAAVTGGEPAAVEPVPPRSEPAELSVAPPPAAAAPRPVLSAPVPWPEPPAPKLEPAPAPEPPPAHIAPALAPPAPQPPPPIPPAPSTAPLAPLAPLDVPRFLHAAQPPPPRRGLKLLAAVAALLLIASAAVITRQAWMPGLTSGIARVRGVPPAVAPSPPPPTIGLSLADTNGQLQIRWEHSSPAVRDASNALLEILDSGASPRAIPLDAAHLETGSFTYARQGEKVDVVMVIDPASPRGARESSTFVGKMPETLADDPRPDHDALTAQNAKLQSDLKAANDHIRSLEKMLSDERELLRIRQRLSNQIPK